MLLLILLSGRMFKPFFVGKHQLMRYEKDFMFLFYYFMSVKELVMQQN